MIRGLSTHATDDVRQILVAVSWFGPAPGAFGPMSGFDFHTGGAFDYWFLVFVDDRVEQKSVTGTFEVSGNKIEIVFDKGQARSGSFQGRLTEKGALVFAGEDAPDGPYTDDRSDCSA